MIQKGGGGASPTAALFRATVSAMPRTDLLPHCCSCRARRRNLQTLWVKQLSRVVGVEIHAVTIALSAFFAGLAVGGVIFGRMADRSARPLRLYAALEAGAAVLGLTSTVALARAAPLYVSLQDSVGVLAWLLPCVLVAAPACLIGGTLPAMLRALHPDDHGCGACDRPPLRRQYDGRRGRHAGHSVSARARVRDHGGGSLRLRTATDGGRSGACRRLARDQPRTPADGGRAATPRRPPRPRAVRRGRGVAMGYEVIWSELLVQFLSTRAYAFAVMLATYLAGLALGSYLFARSDRRRTIPGAPSDS